MRITWLISSPVTTGNGDWYSPLASVRYRVLAPARYLRDEGHQVRFVRFDEPLEPEDLDRALRADAVVISKVLARGSVEYAERARRLGSRLIVDLCDDHFDSPELGKAHSLLCRMADRVVASTRAMAEVIMRRTGQQAAVVDDPFEGPAGMPQFAPSSSGVKLLWFGHPVNFDTVQAMMPSLGRLSRSLPLSLQVISSAGQSNIVAYLQEIQARHRPSMRVQFTAWSPEATWQGLCDCDLVVVPSLPDAKKLVKSPNRVVEPLRAGRFVVAYPLPSYQELADHLCVGEDMAEGIAWAVNHPTETLARIRSGQEYVHRRFAPKAVARVWEAVLEQVVEQERRVA